MFEENAFKYLKNLSVLDMNNNDIATLNINLKETSLKQLFLQNNYLSNIGDAIAKDLENLS